MIEFLVNFGVACALGLAAGWYCADSRYWRKLCREYERQIDRLQRLVLLLLDGDLESASLVARKELARFKKEYPAEYAEAMASLRSRGPIQ